MVRTIPVTKSVSKTRPDLTQAKPIAAVRKTGATIENSSLIIRPLAAPARSSLGLFQRRQTQQCDLIALAANDFKPRVVVLKDLSYLGNRL